MTETKFVGTARIVGASWEIRARADAVMMLKRLFRKADRGDAGKVALPINDETARELEWFSLRYPLKFEPEDVIRAAAERQRSRERAAVEILGPDYKPTPAPACLAFPLRDYQEREVDLTMRTGRLLNMDVLGLGKTVMAIGVVARARPAAIVCQAGVMAAQWRDEIARFLPGVLIHIVEKMQPYPLPKFLGNGPDVVILNYHKLPDWADVLGRYVRTVVFDEAQDLRHHDTERYKAATALAKSCDYRVELTATPIYNYGDEAWSLLEILAPGAMGTRSEFVTEWCEPAGAGKYALRNPRAFGSYLRERGIAVRHTRAEVGRELPEVQHVRHVCETDPAALAAIRSDATKLAESILSSSLAPFERMQAGERLDGKIRQATGIAKAPYVAQFVRMIVESGEKVLLAAWHRAVYEVYLDVLKDLGVVMYTGTESPAEKAKSKAAFVSGSAQVMCMSLRSGAGIEGLQRASSVTVHGELDWSPGPHGQIIGRLRRDDLKAPVVAYWMVAETGSDPVIEQTLDLKNIQRSGITDPDQESGFQAAPVAMGESRSRQLARAYLESIRGKR